MAQSAALKVPLGQPPELYRNYATDERLAATALKYVQRIMPRVRTNRQRTDRLAYRRYNQWALVTDDQFYKGRSNTYLPAVRRGIERMVTQWIREAFPTAEWWSLEAQAEEYEQNVEGMRTLMSIQLKQRMKMKRKARPAFRQLALYGTSPWKVTWRVETKTEVVQDLGPDGQTPVLKNIPRVVYDDPDQKVVDYFSWGVYPETIMDVEEARLVYEDMLEEYDTLKADTKNYANLDKIKGMGGSGSTGTEAFQKRTERLQQLGITESELNDADFVFLTEYYFDFDFKDGMGPVPAIFSVAWDAVVVRLQRNPYARAPYFVHKDAEMPNEYLAHARTEATDRMQISLNDHSNQDMDASSFANSPIVVIDPNYAEDVNAISLYPSAKILAPPECVKFDRPPEAAYSQKEKVAFLYSLILENLGAPSAASSSPAAKGQARGARTFGGMQMIQSLSDSEAKEVIEFQEDAVFEPMLAYIAWLNAHFMDGSRTLRTVGHKGASIVVNRDTFKGDYAYDWLGTTTMANQTLRSTQILVFLNVIRGIQAQPGYHINFPFVLKSWWKWQGLPDADRVVVEDAAMESVDPRLEAELLRQGRQILVSPRDNDSQHVIAHQIDAMREPPDSPVRAQLLQHVAEHNHAAQMKQMAMLQHQMQLAQQAESGPPGGQNGTGPAGPQPRGARAGRAVTMTPQTGMGPARAMASAPGGM